MIFYGHAQSNKDLDQILDLQKENIEAVLSLEEVNREGFVTVNHSFSLLKRMNSPFPHIIAKSGNKIIGYALIMLREFAQEIEVLIPMFELINTLKYDQITLKEKRFFIMGQACIAKPFRGKGVFQGLYQKMKNSLSQNFDYVITEVSKRNQRSLRAHEKIGFKIIHEYSSGGEEWVLLLWDWG